MTAIVLGFFAIDTLRNAPETFVAIAMIGVLAILLNAGWIWYSEKADKVPREAS